MTMKNYNLKRGRWSVRERSLGRRIGIAMNEDIKSRLTAGIRHYSHDKKCTIREMHMKVLAHYFCDGHELQGDVFVPILKPEEQLPTFRQFQYFYKEAMKSMPQIKLRQRSYALRTNQPGAK